MNDEISIPPNSLVALARAEIDQQIATAHAYPRDVKKAISNMIALASINDETAADCIFALPRGGKELIGPSIRLAEIIVSQWGNCRSFCRVTEINRELKYVEIEGVYLDLETNHSNSSPIRRSIARSTGAIYSDDMINMATNAAASIAKRNAILGGVPRPIWGAAYEAAFKRVAGDIRNLDVTRQKSIEAFGQFGITERQVCAALGVEKATDIKHRSIVTLRGMFTAIKNEEATIEEIFGVSTRQQAKPETQGSAPAAQAEAKPETKPEPAAEAKPVPDDDFPGDRQATAVAAPARRGPPPPPQAKPVVEPDKEPAKPEVSQAEPADNQADEAAWDLDVVLHDMKLDLAKARSEKAVLQLLDDNERAVNAMNPAQSKILSDAVRAARAKFSNRSAA